MALPSLAAPPVPLGPAGERAGRREDSGCRIPRWPQHRAEPVTTPSIHGWREAGDRVQISTLRRLATAAGGRLRITFVRD